MAASHDPAPLRTSADAHTRSTSQPRQPSTVLEIADLSIRYRRGSMSTLAVKGVSFSVKAGETVAIVGESGSGKSTTAMAVIRLLSSGGEIAGGSIRFEGAELTALSDVKMRELRGASIGLVPQDPMTNLDPMMRIGEQLVETIRAHKRTSLRDARAGIRGSRVCWYCRSTVSLPSLSA